MENKQELKKQTKSEKIFAVIPKTLKERVLRYKAKNNMSESEIVNIALNEFFKVKMIKEDIDDITEIMGKAIENKLGKRFERMIMLIAKTGKSSYASLFLQAYVLSKICESEESKEFLKEKIELANKLAYGVIKNKFLDTDISQMIPEDLDFDNIIKQEYKLEVDRFKGGIIFKWLNKEEIYNKYNGKGRIQNLQAYIDKLHVDYIATRSGTDKRI